MQAGRMHRKRAKDAGRVADIDHVATHTECLTQGCLSAKVFVPGNCGEAFGLMVGGDMLSSRHRRFGNGLAICI